MYKKLNFNLVSYKNLNISPRGIRTIQTYLLSKRNDKDTRQEGTIGRNATIELYDTIKKYAGLDLDFYKDDDGNIMIEEISENGKRMISLSEPEKAVEHLEYLTYIGLQGKINNSKQELVRDEEESEIKEIEFRDGKREVSLYKENNYRLKDENGKLHETKMLDKIKEEISKKFSNMSIEDLNKFSKFEYRKMISAKYSDVLLTKKEIDALDYYKGSRIHTNK